MTNEEIEIAEWVEHEMTKVDCEGWDFGTTNGQWAIWDRWKVWKAQNSDEYKKLEDKFNQLQADNVKMLEFIESMANSPCYSGSDEAQELLKELEGE